MIHLFFFIFGSHLKLNSIFTNITLAITLSCIRKHFYIVFAQVQAILILYSYKHVNITQNSQKSLMVTVWESGTLKAGLTALQVYCFRWSECPRTKANFTTLVLLSLRMVPLLSNKSTSFGKPLSTPHCNTNSSPSVPWIMPWCSLFSILRFFGGSKQEKKQELYVCLTVVII